MLDSRTPRKKWAALAMVGLLVLVLLPLPVSAGTTQVMAAHLPTPRDGTASVATDDAIYIFGGDEGSARSDQILRYDTRTDTLAVMGAKLPSPRSGISAVWDGQYAYVFGGWSSPYSDEIVRYDPATDTVDVLPERLPSARIYTSAVWTGQYAYIFGGGVSSASTTDEIVRYDPASGTVTTTNAVLPSPRYGTSAIYDGAYAYVIGGITLSTGEKHDQVVRYDPATDTVSLLASKLPTPRYHTSAVYAAGAAHIFGGHDCGSGEGCDTIINIDLDSGTVTTNSTVLTSARYLTSAAYFGRYAYIIGGVDGTRKDQILRHGAIEANHAPTIDPIENLTHQATIALTVNVSAHDVDNDLLTLSAPVLPAGATFTDHGGGAGTFEWTPQRNELGDHEVEIQADDGTATRNETFWIHVTEAPDRPPVIDPIADQNATAEETFTLAVQANDPDGDPITLSMSGPNGSSFTDHGDGTGAVSWTPTREQEGTHGFEITASANGNSSTETFDVNVSLPPNRAPVIDPIADREHYFGDEVTWTFEATDPDGDNLTLSLSPIPTNATFTDHGNGTATLSWGIDTSHEGNHNLTIAADDGALTTTESFEVDVYSSPAPALEPIDDLSVDEGTEVTIQAIGSDPEGRPLLLTIAPTPLPGDATFVDHGDDTATFHWSTGPTDVGNYTLTVTADNGDRTTDETFTLTVLEKDFPPKFTSGTGPVAIGEGEDLAVFITAEDPDGTPVTLTSGSLPAGATFIDNGNDSATLTWNDATPPGTYTIALTATSGDLATTETLTIEVVKSYDFTIVGQGSTRIHASPFEVVPLRFTITNTGAKTDTYTISLQDLSSQPEGWSVGPTPSVTIAPGEEQLVTVNLTVPEDGTYSKPRITVRSEGNPSLAKIFTWTVYVPVRIEVVPIDENPSLVEEEALIFFEGVVQLTWENGLPARNLSFSYRHVLHKEPIIVHSGDDQVDENGTWVFGGTDHPAMGIPHVNHHLYVDVPYGRFTYSGVGSWQAGPPWV